MSFRKEEKLHIHKNQLHNLLEWIVENDGYKLYDTRVVSSTYFDNGEMQMFKESEEGCVPRKKIRVRSYSKQVHKPGESALEIKTSSVEGRFKTTDKKFNLGKVMSIGVFDKDYGVCKSKVRVSYKRDYYKIHDVRLTIDREIEYTQLNAQGKGVYKEYEPDIIVEVKAGNFVSVEYLMRKFHFDRVRFSKYSRAVIATC
ncbi:VTC domain-containing protein [Candidatus Thioglobus sp.]|nr:VTC domain-containing protein [Candidatus Thioglobus sp.]